MLNIHSIAVRIALIAVIAIVSIAAGGYLAYGTLRDALIAQKEVELRDEVQTALGVIQSFRDQEARGTLNRDKAQAAAREALRPIRFGADENYFFVYTYDGVNLLIGPKPELEGKNLIEMKDPNGFPLIRAMIDKARVGGGLVAYQWVKPGAKDASAKFSYAMAVPDWNWMVGTGFHIDDVEAQLAASLRSMAVNTAAALTLIALVALFVTRGIARPLKGLTRSMDRLRSGDLDAAIEGADRKDEIGLIAQSVSRFRDLQRERHAAEAEAAARRHVDDEQRRRETLENFAGDFENSVGKIVDLVASAATELQATASQLTGSAQQTSERASSVSAAAEEAGTSVASVASSSEELGASVGEIGRQVAHSSAQAQAAVQEAERTAGVVGELSQAASRINGIVEMISTIAGQTNLLALNATIEAARAGEAGRGFAVVASEVKNLAAQTAKATAEISGQIADIQSATERSVRAIENISSTIRGINDTSSAIASAVEQQGLATREIVVAVSHASAGTGEVTGHITGVARTAEETGAAAEQVFDASSALAKHAEELRGAVDRFLHTVRAA